MAKIDFKQVTTLTFDCYGTLVDWERGACTALRKLMPNCSSQITDDELIRAFLVADSHLIKGEWMPYECILAKAAAEVCMSFGQPLDQTGEAEFVASLPTWPLFEETIPALFELSQKYRLAIISNINDHLIEQTLINFPVTFDVITTSERTRSYKPEMEIFTQALQELGGQASSIIHVAEGLCEATPARKLGMASIWVRRTVRSDDGSGATPDVTIASLSELVELLSEKTDV